MAFSLHYKTYLPRRTPEGEIEAGTLNSSLRKEKGSLKLMRPFFLSLSWDDGQIIAIHSAYYFILCA
jgi:hypothetical protein